MLMDHNVRKVEELNEAEDITLFYRVFLIILNQLRVLNFINGTESA
jgi:hypothetical protein